MLHVLRLAKSCNDRKTLHLPTFQWLRPSRWFARLTLRQAVRTHRCRLRRWKLRGVRCGEGKRKHADRREVLKLATDPYFVGVLATWGVSTRSSTLQWPRNRDCKVFKGSSILFSYQHMWVRVIKQLMKDIQGLCAFLTCPRHFGFFLAISHDLSKKELWAWQAILLW